MANRLAREASPYLLQHAHNPVDWYPWGDEALAEAKRADKPILLSIGYSACHWCHVMERESFENETVAKLMNEWFVNVKVDREERPDLDQIYQLVVQLMGRSGGWPLTVFLTPDQKPFFGGTYFPPHDKYGMPGFPRVLQAVWEAYRTKREEIASQADDLASAIARVSTRAESDATYSPAPDLLERAAKKLSARFDDVHGGFGSRPKFPSTMSLEVLLRRGALEGDARAKERATKALDAMRAGGIYDHLGDGFHRYSTDEAWLVPHFEKMLYDNALLLRLYTDAHRATGEARFADTARAIAAYVAREMTNEGGAFYSTQDADSEGEEGKFFVWTPQEIDAALAGDREAADVAKACFGVTEEGNFEESGATVLHAARAPKDDPEAAALERARARLFEAREKRVKPFRDEKILASWNALMIGALAHAEMIEPAVRAYDWVRSNLVTIGDGGARVARLAKDGSVKGQGFLDDYAYLADAALDLYEATGEPRFVADARALADAMIARFADAEAPGFFFTPSDGEALLCRAKDPYDTAVPSGGSIACKALLRLGALVGSDYAERATKDLERMAATAVENPAGHAQWVSAIDRLVRGSVDIVVVGARADERTLALVQAARKAYLPNRTIAWSDPGNPESQAACAALAEGKPAETSAVAYVCRGRTCSLPIRDVAALQKELSMAIRSP
jgi:uncharacterized protein YyaL (SSP411 family)